MPTSGRSISTKWKAAGRLSRKRPEHPRRRQTRRESCLSGCPRLRCTTGSARPPRGSRARTAPPRAPLNRRTPSGSTPACTASPWASGRPCAVAAMPAIARMRRRRGGARARVAGSGRRGGPRARRRLCRAVSVRRPPGGRRPALLRRVGGCAALRHRQRARLAQGNTVILHCHRLSLTIFP